MGIEELLAQKEREVKEIKMLISLLRKCRDKAGKEGGYFLHISELEEILVNSFLSAE